MAVIIKNAQIKNLHIGPRIISDGLIGWWNAASTLSYPRTGSIWYDLIKKNQNNGSMVNMSAVDFTAEAGGALTFDGTDELVSIDHDSSLDFGADSFTVSLWVKISDAITAGFDGDYLIGKRGLGALGTFPGWQMKVKDVSTFSTSAWRFVHSGIDSGSASQIISLSEQNLLFDTWYMVSLIYNKEIPRLDIVINDSIDSTKFSLSLVGSISNYTPVEICGTRYYNHYFYTNPLSVVPAVVSNVSLYNRNLTIEEINQNYLARKSLFT